MGKLTEYGKLNMYRRWQTYLLIAVLILNVVGIIYFNFTTYKVFFHSDAAVKNLLAEEIVRTGSLFPKDWTYVHDDIFVIFGHLFIIPWLFFVKNGFWLHAVSGIISATLFLGGLWWLTGILKFSKLFRLFTLCLFSSGISPFLAIENLYGQVSYGVVGYLIFFQLATLLRVIEIYPDTKSRSYLLNISIFCLISFLVYLSNPARAFLTYTFPIVSGIGLVLFSGGQINSDKVRREFKAAWVSFAAVIASVTLGWLCHHWLLNKLTSIASGGKGKFLPLEELGNNLGVIMKSLLLLVGANPVPGASAVSFAGVDHFSRFILLIAVLSIPLVFLKKRHVTTNGIELRFLAGFFLASFIPVTYLMIFTNLLDGIEGSRYLVPAFIVGLLFMVGYIENSVKNNGYQYQSVVLLIALMLTAFSGYTNFVKPLVTKNKNGELVIQEPTNPQIRLLAYLQSRGLHYGYASYWNANAITILSGADVIIRPVWLDQKMPRPRYHLSSKNWYTQAAHSGTTFLVVSSAENKILNLDTLIGFAGKPINTYTFEDNLIYVFNSNFASTVFGWSTTFDMPETLWFSDATPHTVGRFVGHGKNGWMESFKGESGALVFGPYQAMELGRYTATFDVSGCEGQSPVVAGFVDVSSSNGTIVGARAKIDVGDEQWHNVRINFEVKKSGEYEFRVLPNGSGCLRARSVTIEKSAEILRKSPSSSKKSSPEKGSFDMIAYV